ncbi:MAG TPA: FAD-dependent oxidoreductase, partial [Dehalococcoidia bacterium]|nr:FAD-dependent oxidoreductase [Dehalococcoidia bacterium]
RVWSLSEAPWPPGPPAEWLDLIRLARPSFIPLLPHLNRTVAGVLRRHRAGSRRLRGFVDAQLMITAQAGADETAWLYGATALDFARPGVFTVAGGIGAIAECLAEALHRQGGQVLFKRRVTAIRPAAGGYQVETARGEVHQARSVIANLSPADLAGLLDDPLRRRLPSRWRGREAPWGAAMAYLELDAAFIPPGFADHHQILCDYDEPIGEGNSVFFSLSPAWDTARAPAGLRVATLSTHTRARAWWQTAGREEYRERRADYTERLIGAAERALPSLRSTIRRILPATPVTFHRFTRRAAGYVGGFPQTSLFDAIGPGTGLPNLYLVGDSTFPGQSTAAVTLGAERLVRRLLR